MIIGQRHGSRKNVTESNGYAADDQPAVQHGLLSHIHLQIRKNQKGALHQGSKNKDDNIQLIAQLHDYQTSLPLSILDARITKA
ncbi:MAG: hypothetical protein IKM64_04320 [Clostridia bacterium]|nr:hypothetical protein [Clostridia bacterium]